MNNKWQTAKWFVLPVGLVALFILLFLQKEDRTNEATATLEAEPAATVAPEPSAAVNEVAAAVPTEESVEGAPEIPALEEFVSVTDFFSLGVPTGWASEETFSGGALVMANSEAALARYQDGRDAEPGDFVLNVGFLPFSLFRQREVVPLNIQLEAAPDVFLASMLPMFNVQGQAVLGQVSLVESSGGRPVGLLTISDDGREGLILLVAAGDGVVAVISTAGFPGEAATHQDIALAVADGLTFRGDEAALYGAFLNG